MIDNKTSFISMNENFLSIITFVDDEYRINVNIIYWYALIMNSLMYAITMICSDLKFTLSIFFRYYFNSNLIHVKITTQLLCYVKKTLHFNIYYENKENLINYIDAN